MAAGQTKLANLFNPQVVGDLIATELPKKIKNEVVKVINDYFTITMKLKDYIINNICFKRSK